MTRKQFLGLGMALILGFCMSLLMFGFMVVAAANGGEVTIYGLEVFGWYEMAADIIVTGAALAATGTATVWLYRRGYEPTQQDDRAVPARRRRGRGAAD